MSASDHEPEYNTADSSIVEEISSFSGITPNTTETPISRLTPSYAVSPIQTPIRVTPLTSRVLDSPDDDVDDILTSLDSTPIASSSSPSDPLRFSRKASREIRSAWKDVEDSRDKSQPKNEPISQSTNVSEVLREEEKGREENSATSAPSSILSNQQRETSNNSSSFQPPPHLYRRAAFLSQQATGPVPRASSSKAPPAPPTEKLQKIARQWRKKALVC